MDLTKLRSAAVAIALLPLAALASPDCAPTMTFFPPGAEDFNVPIAWGRTMQRKAGNPYADQLFTVLLSSDKNLPGSFAKGVPMLQVLPQHPLLTLGATGINATCRGQVHTPKRDADGEAPAPKASKGNKEDSKGSAAAAAPAAGAADGKGADAAKAGANAKGPAAAPAASPAPAADKASTRRRRRRELLATGQIVTVPRVQISYVLNAVIVPPEPTPDAVDKFVTRYGASNATNNPDMAEAEIARQISKLQELSISTNWTIAERAHKALNAYAAQQRKKGEEEAAVLAAEAAAVARRPQQTVQLGRNVQVGEFANLNPAPRIKLDGLDTLPDGYYCMQIIVTIMRGTGYLGQYKVPARDMSTVREVCFYKLDSPPTARVKFHTCGPKFSMEMTDINPVPVEVFPGTGKMLFTPVYHLKGTLNRTAQWWVPIPEGVKQRFDYWAVIGRPPSNTTIYEYIPEETVTLAEGFWQIQVDGGLLSEFPSLLSTDAVGQFGKADDDPDPLGDWMDMPGALQGLPKYAGGKQNLTRMFGLQMKETGFNSFNGPDGGIPLNEEFTFSWDIDGFGHQYCYTDGERRQNDADYMCKSPMTAQINDDATNHTFLVIMQDVCGGKVRVLAKYGAWGYSLEEATRRGEKIFDPETFISTNVEKLVLNTTHTADVRRVRERNSANAPGGSGGSARAVAIAAAAAAMAAALWL